MPKTSRISGLFRLPHQGQRSRELDFVRGVAILLVLGLHFFTIPNEVWLYHAFEFPGRQFGGSGVDLFFVLSGFLVGGLLLKEYKKTGNLNVRSFIFRRGFKIWPAYYLFILIEVITHAHPLGTFLWQNAFHLQNYVGTAISHTWTLSLEEHFYLILALAVGWMVHKHWTADRILKVLIATMAVVLIIRTVTVFAGWPGATEYTHNRIDSLLAGVVLATLFHFYPDKFKDLSRHAWPLILITAAVVLFMIFVKDWTIRNSIGFTVTYIGAAAFLLLVYEHSGRAKEFWLYKIVAAVGVYSYAIYLYQNSIRNPSMSIARHFPHALQWPVLMICQYGLAILAGVVMTQLVEWPFLRLRNRILPQDVQDIGGPSVEPDVAVQSSTVSKKRWVKVVLFVFAALVALEGAVRMGLGLGNPLLYMPDAESSYVLLPDQDVTRFGRHIHVNRWGMRSEDLTDRPGPGLTRVLFLGDSVTYGTAQTDQTQTYPYLTVSKLKDAESLNPSCGGWAPANELGWLQKHGTYGSQVVVLEFNDHDLNQPMTGDLTLSNPNYPRSKPLSGLWEGLTRYVITKLLHKSYPDPGTGQDTGGDAVASVRETVGREIHLAEHDGAKVVVLLVRLNPNVNTGPQVRSWRKDLEASVGKLGVPVVEANLTDPAEYYDSDHPSPSGNEVIAGQLAPLLATLRKGN